ncbi:hypothetical protein JG687_00012872 [Phytophthora cactorum]|uniref:RxLR effector protein n=1 Tax=Phytophthora cactorum TaxID=29920 RepID=A0A329RGL9_9STRA|nr:hypothetical protein JG687_00012872 [Phytophthora cactorum]RAW23521.1 hypothetical protein PC110_g20046 [Phytophthora cactorum]
MQRLLLVVMALLLVAMALVSASSGSFGVVEKDSGNSTTTVGGTQNTTVFQPADDFLPKSNGGHGNGNDEASKAGVKAPRDGNGGGLSKVAVGVIVSVTLVALALGVGMVVCAWRASRREEEAMFMDLGDERSYTYGRFGDYAAM